MAQGVSVVMISHQHWLRGIVETEGRRLLDLLDDKMTDYVPLSNVRICRSTDPDVGIAKLPETLIYKATVSLAVITGEEHEAPDRRLHAFVQKKRYPVFLTVPNYEMKGTMHLAYGPDPMAVLTRDTGDFFPITQAVVSLSSNKTSFKAETVLVNKAHLNLFYLGKTPVTT